MDLDNQEKLHFQKKYNKRLVKKPKLYFTDTGLVCSLLGIRKKEELDYHYLKGGIFEIYYWRDNHKKEIDLLLDIGTKQFGIEIKSSGTVNEKYFDGLKYWKELTKTDTGDFYLIYGGSENMVRNGMNVVSWKNIFDGIVKKTI